MGASIIIAVPKSGWLNTMNAGKTIIKVGIMNDIIFSILIFLSDKYLARKMIEIHLAYSDGWIPIEPIKIQRFADIE